MNKHLSVSVHAFLVAGSSAFAQCDLTWANPSNTGPTIRAYPGMAFDTNSNQVIMYGGGTGSQYRRDILAWNGTMWTVLNNGLTSGPGARRGVFMTWDADRARAIVFGGGGVTSRSSEPRWLLVADESSLTSRSHLARSIFRSPTSFRNAACSCS